jgi:hypothetical protein
MSKDRDEQDPLARACELVGRFLYHFGRVERKISETIWYSSRARARVMGS